MARFIVSVVTSIFFLVGSTSAATLPNQAGIFDQPHVFLTLSSVAGLDNGNGEWADTLFELNWYGFDISQDGDWVGLYGENPTLNVSAVPLASTLVNSTSGERGYHKTNVRFGHPPITSDDEVQIDNCLGYWIAYHRSTTILVSNCFRKYPRWMKNLREFIGGRRISQLMIPGTHDAGAIRVYDGIPAENPFTRYSVTQEELLYRQFIHGIRYVDIRVAHYPATAEKWWINHGDARFQPLETLFTAVRRFVEETGEIIFMDFHGFPVGFDNLTTHDALLVYVVEQVGDLLVLQNAVPTGDPTPNQIWATNRTVILTYQVDSVSEQYPFLWPYLIHAWGNKNTVPPLEEYFENEALPRYGCAGSWWSAMAEMTTTTEDALLQPLVGLRGFAQRINIPLTYWWMRPTWYSRTMIVSTDFFLGNNIIEMAMKVNRERASCPSL